MTDTETLLDWLVSENDYQLPRVIEGGRWGLISYRANLLSVRRQILAVSIRRRFSRD